MVIPSNGSDCEDSRSRSSECVLPGLRSSFGRRARGGCSALNDKASAYICIYITCMILRHRLTFQWTSRGWDRTDAVRLATVRATGRTARAESRHVRANIAESNGTDDPAEIETCRTQGEGEGRGGAMRWWHRRCRSRLLLENAKR